MPIPSLATTLSDLPPYNDSSSNKTSTPKANFNCIPKTPSTHKKTPYNVSHEINPSSICSFGTETTADEVFFNSVFQKVSQVRLGRFLELHHLKEKLRSKMIDWMLEVLTAYKQREATIFKAIFLMDMYYANLDVEIPVEELHIVGIACMFIASKSEEVKFIKIDACYKAIGREKFSKELILEKELEVLKVLDYRTSIPTAYDLMACAFRFVKTDDQKSFERCALLISKMCLCSYEIVSKIPIKDIVLSSIILAIKITHNNLEIEDTVPINIMLDLFQIDNVTDHETILRLIYSFVSDFERIITNVKHLESFKNFVS